ncbi:MAG: glucose-6-phosphate isomerase [Candidatus Accumulibacter sp.]|nr:glucose-6-phosphate isomerase [Accumulibacter sp.]
MPIESSMIRAELEEVRELLQWLHLRELFSDDPDRAKRLSLSLDGIHCDFSKQRVSPEALRLLCAWAEESGVGDAIADMFAGKRINRSENRPALHVALRRSSGPFPDEAFDVMPDVVATRERMAAFAEELRGGEGDAPIRDVVNIGIGGSDLGPKMMTYAMRSIAHPTLRIHTVSNLDGAQLAPLLQTLDPRATLFIVVSKTFTTQETLLNAHTARAWLAANLGEAADLRNYFAAISSNVEKAVDFGVAPERIFPIWDWVGGRYSLWSAVGLALMTAIGPQAFDAMLRGAERIDEHFRTAPFPCNLPVLMALIGVWNTNFLGAETSAVLPYNESLRYFPPFLQQLEMESNGKSVGVDGKRLRELASPIVWGGLGNNGQHAFFQLLHQGGRLVPCDFIVAARSDYPLPNHHEALLANCFAQSAALAFGRTEDEARDDMEKSKLDPAKIEELLPHRTFAGNQPSTTLLLSAITPENLGALVALYEHKTFVQGVLWGVNPFDQWGVELGKSLASRILPAVREPERAQGLDASTRELLAFSRDYLL